MQNLIQIKGRINAIKATRKVVEAMRLITVSSYPKLIKTNENIKDFVKTMEESLIHIKSYQEPSQNAARQSSKCCRNIIIVAASAKGLCGGFNSQLEKTLNQKFDFNPEQNYEFIALGKRAEALLERANTVKNLPRCSKVTFPPLNQQNLKLIALKIQEYINQNLMISSIYVVSNRFKSIFYNKPAISQILPFTLSSQTQKPAENVELPEIIFEQNIDQIIKYLSQKLLINSIYALLHESILCETAARFVTTDSASQSASKKIEQLSLKYNKLRQAAITREVAELSSCT